MIFKQKKNVFIEETIRKALFWYNNRISLYVGIFCSGIVFAAFYHLITMTGVN